ncbi:hypothetical protein [Hansschlegelia zhihuaiae]|uniref:Uncharacterized protein n=1 Tax=Hansschlegelia zhihuaiae TaxID=405005 RepID=A0A4Q0MBX5_9HYPH|nr:hypothetical protein [Hansschlegelia zhihuaiae]RXF70266.1 hypothetical protein EK403_17055 [Hansschlegelia zhihuaiae]
MAYIGGKIGDEMPIEPVVPLDPRRLCISYGDAAASGHSWFDTTLPPSSSPQNTLYLRRGCHVALAGDRTFGIFFDVTGFVVGPSPSGAAVTLRLHRAAGFGAFEESAIVWTRSMGRGETIRFAGDLAAGADLVTPARWWLTATVAADPSVPATAPIECTDNFHMG